MIIKVDSGAGTLCYPPGLTSPAMVTLTGLTTTTGSVVRGSSADGTQCLITLQGAGLTINGKTRLIGDVWADLIYVTTGEQRTNCAGVGLFDFRTDNTLGINGFPATPGTGSAVLNFNNGAALNANTRSTFCVYPRMECGPLFNATFKATQGTPPYCPPFSPNALVQFLAQCPTAP